MPSHQTQSGFVSVDKAKIYYEIKGEGTPFVMIHAGVADNRQWENEFAVFSKEYRVIRYDMRGYGKSEPVDGDFNLMNDLAALLDAVAINESVILMGCSMGGGLAMDFALTHPSKVKALIMVGSGPSGLELDVPSVAKFEEAEKAYEAGDLDLLAEIETQIWFDGSGRTPEQVDPIMRKLAFDMNRKALGYEALQLGKRQANTVVTAFDRLHTIKIPVQVIVGEHDTPYILASAEYMERHIPTARKTLMQDAAHLPNMDHPEKFQSIVKAFLSISKQS